MPSARRRGGKLLLPAIRAEVCRLNRELPKHGLVTWTSGNVSVRDPKTGYVVIKPSGIKFEDLTPANMSVVDLEGNVVQSATQPSVDGPTHLFIYARRPDVHGIVHTHSAYATAFAAVNRPIPVFLTAIADEFGGPIPVGPYARIGGEEIGRSVVDHIGSSPAILLKNHGVFTVGATGEAALKAAVMVEDVARTVWFALQLGQPDELPADEVARAHRRYAEKYGARGGAAAKLDTSI